MNKRKMGSESERTVGAYLKEQGYEILEYNFRCRQAEIDIVAREDRFLVFVEVKSRSSKRNGAPEEAVGFHKQNQIRRAALYYMARFRVPENTPIRFDVAAVQNGRIHLIRNAFLF